MVGRVAFAMVLGPGEIDSNIVSCNAFVFIELLEAHFFTHNDWVESSFQFIVLLIGFLSCPHPSSPLSVINVLFL